MSLYYSPLSKSVLVGNADESYLSDPHNRRLQMR